MRVIQTSGQKLKQKYGLKGNNIVYTQILNIPFKIYIIFYRSRNINRIITDYEIRQRLDTILSIKRNPFNKECLTLPLRDLEELDSDLTNSLIFSLDLDGTDICDKNNRVLRQYEDLTSHPDRILEWMTFQNLNTLDSISSFTQNTRKLRNKKVGSENFTAKLIACQYYPKDDSLLFLFGTKSTDASEKNKIIKKVNPEQDFKLENNPQREYGVYFKILDFMKWLKETRPSILEDKEITWKEIKDVLKVAYIQVFCECPAFHYQGINYWLSQLDGSMYPTDIKPKRWNASHLHGDGNAFLCKHSYGIIRYIEFFGNQMASMCRKALIQSNLI